MAGQHTNKGTVHGRHRPSCRVPSCNLPGAIFAGAFVASVTPSPTPTPTPTDTPTPAPTVSPAAPPTLEPSEWVTSKCFDEAWSTEAIGSFPQFVAVRDATEAFDCRVIWDSRIFDVAPAVLAVNSDVREVDHELLEGGVLLLHVPEGTTALLFNVAGVNLYPNENIGTPQDTLFEIVDGANVLASVPVPATTAPCAPWALEIEAEWTTVDGVIAPLAVRMISRGPNPIPANSVVDVVTTALIDPAFAVPSAGIAVSHDRRWRTGQSACASCPGNRDGLNRNVGLPVRSCRLHPPTEPFHHQ